MSLSSYLILFGVLFLFALAWYCLNYLLAPHMAQPDVSATITGACGDTMEIGFKLEQGRVIKTHCWTNGCSLSRQCLEAAAYLALDRKLDDVRAITMVDIMEQVGKLPESHLHCALLAETTLQTALKNYSVAGGKTGQTSCTPV